MVLIMYTRIPILEDKIILTNFSIETQLMVILYNIFTKLDRVKQSGKFVIKL